MRIRTRKIHSQAEIDLLIPLISEEPDFSAVRDPELWRIIRNCAGRHGVAPLVAYAVRPHVSEGQKPWCDAILAQSWSAWRESLAGLEFVAGELGRRGIPLMALKGPVLACRHYDPAFLRMPSSDLDLGLRACDLGPACEALKDTGYSLESPLEASLRFSHHAVMLHPSRARLELHFRLSHGPFGPSVDPFFDHAAKFRLPGGSEVLTLDGAAEILHLALHVVCGRFRPFFHVYELRRLCAAAGARVVRDACDMAVRYHFAGAVALIDAAFKSCWGEAFLPADFPMPRTWLHGRINEKLWRACCQWSAPGRGHTLRSRIQGRWLDIQTTDRSSDALRQIRMLARLASFRLRRNLTTARRVSE